MIDPPQCNFVECIPIPNNKFEVLTSNRLHQKANSRCKDCYYIYRQTYRLCHSFTILRCNVSTKLPKCSQSRFASQYSPWHPRITTSEDDAVRKLEYLCKWRESWAVAGSTGKHYPDKASVRQCLEGNGEGDLHSLKIKSGELPLPPIIIPNCTSPIRTMHLLSIMQRQSSF